MNPLYRKTRFLLSAPELRTAPPDVGREVAFAGRSNVGKSTAINAVTGQHSLARTSKTPGRTQQIVFFSVDPERRLVDLPGYGYAKVGWDLRRRWNRVLEDYLRKRQSLAGLILIMDIRHPLTPYDQQLIAWSQQAELPLHLVLTKADKLKRSAGQTTLMQVRRTVQKEYGELTLQLFSGPKQVGLNEIHQILDRWLLMEDIAVP